MVFSSYPSEWQLVKLSDLGEVNRGRSRHRPRYAEHLYGGPYPFLQTGDIKSSGGRINSYQQTYSEAGLAQSRLWPAGTMCITIAANIAETGILEFPACFPDSVIGFIADESRCDIFFVEYMFRHLKRHIQHQASGSVQDNINLGTLEKLQFPIPPLGEQKAIAHILGTFDDKIELNQQMNRTLEAIARAIFKSWFIDFDPVRAKMDGQQPAGMDAETAALFPDEFEDSALGQIPKGWEIKPFQSIVSVKDGTHSSPKVAEVGYALVTSRHLKNGYLDFDSTYLISEQDFHEVNKRSKVDKNDILITMIGTVGNLFFVDYEKINFAIKNVGLFKTSEKPELSEYLYCYLKSSNIENHLAIRQSGTTQSYITLKILRNIPVILPPSKIIKNFRNNVLSLFQKMTSNREESNYLTSIRDTLLPKLLSGEIRVKDAEKILEEVV